MIKFQDVSFFYEENKSPTLKGINLNIKKGEFVVLTGKSGCGKTTLLCLINGLIPNYYEGKINGSITIEEKKMNNFNMEKYLGVVGSVSQDPRSQFFMLNSTCELCFGLENLGYSSNDIKNKVSNTVKKFKMEKLLNRNLMELSSGEKQKIAIASIYAMNSKIIVLDEPAANLDSKSKLELYLMLKQMKDEGKTIIISEHQFYYFYNLIDRVIYLEAGEITQEFTGTEFQDLKEEERENLGLRSINFNYIPHSIKSYHGNSNELSIRNLSISYDKNRCLSRNINIDVSRGEVIGIIGNNGVGKSTFIRTIVGLMKEREGSINLENKKTKRKDRMKASYLVMQDCDYQLFTSSVMDEMQLSGYDLKEEKIEHILKNLGLFELRDRHPQSLSGGQKQRLCVATACVSNKEVICFDEPTSGLDLYSMKAVAEIIRSLARMGKIVFVISHDYEFTTRCCTRCFCLTENGVDFDGVMNIDTIGSLKKILIKG